MRTYKRRSTFRRDRRDRSVALRAEGLSLRQIAAKVGASYETVRRDLAAWDEQQEKVSRLPVTNLAPGGDFRDTGRDSGATVTPLNMTIDARVQPPPPRPEPERCPECGYLLTALGHRLKCGGHAGHRPK